jgi:hypothetical protein
VKVAEVEGFVDGKGVRNWKSRQKPAQSALFATELLPILLTNQISWPKESASHASMNHDRAGS